MYSVGGWVLNWNAKEPAKQGAVMVKRRRIFSVFHNMALPLALAATMVAEEGESFKARLSPVPIDLAMQSTVAGSGSLIAVLTGSKLSITGKFEGLRSPATIARVGSASD